jgi:Tn3 transposase DDE domain
MAFGSPLINWRMPGPRSWTNTVYLELAVNEYVQRHGPVSPEVLAHLSPALMEHVNPYGTYIFPSGKVRDLDGFRPLRLAELTGQATA